MEIALILVREVAVMFLIIAVGVLCKIKGIINEETARSLSNVLLLVIIPPLLIRNLQVDRDPALYPAMAIMFVAAILFHLVAIAIANRAVRDTGDGTTAWRVSKLAIVFSNAGFMGFPLLQQTIGATGVLLGVLFVGVFNVISWIWCVPTLTGKKGLSVVDLLRHPVIIGFAAALFLHFANIRLTGILRSVCNQLADLNTPVSLIIIGAFLASVNVRDALTDKRVYKVIFLRNLLIPMLTIGLLWASRITAWMPGTGKVLALSLLILASCPAATNTIQMSARYRCDSIHGAKLVAASTAVSIVTLPLMVFLGDLIL